MEALSVREQTQGTRTAGTAPGLHRPLVATGPASLATGQPLVPDAPLPAQGTGDCHPAMTVTG